MTEINTQPAFPETTRALKRLRQAIRVNLTVTALRWAAKSLGRLGLVDLQLAALRISAEMFDRLYHEA